jgi:tetratricopeptide (TPR) repeat protein
VKLIGGSAAISGVGRYILRGGDARADERARRLLDWLRADVDRTSSPEAARFQQLWGQGIAASHEAIQLAAAVLAGATDPDRVLRIAARCASTVPDAELACHEARFAAYRERGQWPEAVAESEAILALRAGPNDARARTHAWVLARAGRFDEADRVLDAALARGGDRRDAMWGRFEVAAMRAMAGASAADILQRGDALVNDPAAGPLEFNYVAWHHLGLTGTPGMPGDLTGALELARKAVGKAPQVGGVLNTLAALEAERGELDRAIHDSRKAMELHNAAEPTAGDWYVIGRILEQLGLNSDAITAYKRVTRPPEDEVVSPYLLAQRRLAAIARP